MPRPSRFGLTARSDQARHRQCFVFLVIQHFCPLQVSELLANMPDPTQDEVRGEGEDRDKRPCPKEELADLSVNASESELLSDIFGLDLRREGGQYKITPHNPNASLAELLNSPLPAPAPPSATAPAPKLRQRNQVGSDSHISHRCCILFINSLLIISTVISAVLNLAKLTMLL